MNMFSVIIPIYNSEKYIRDCLDSIISQKYKNLEIIIIDDGSTDNSRNICNEYAKKDNRIKIFTQDNKGASLSRNRGIEEASGEYLIFIDSDDWIRENTLEIINKRIEEDNVDLIMYQIIGHNKKYRKIVSEKNLINELSKMIINESINSPVNKVYNLDIIKKNNIRFKENINIAEDLLFNINYFSKIKSMNILEDELYYYNQENNFALTKRYNDKKYLQLMKIDYEIEKILSDFENKKLINAINFIRIKK